MFEQFEGDEKKGVDSMECLDKKSNQTRYSKESDFRIGTVSTVIRIFLRDMTYKYTNWILDTSNCKPCQEQPAKHTKLAKSSCTQSCSLKN